jgi:glucoamylase
MVDRAFGPDIVQYFCDFVDFSLALCRLDGGEFVKRADFGATIDPASRIYARSADELSRIVGDRVLGEPRFNPDGTLDVIKWGRPQHDGPALRALTLLRLWRHDALRERVNRSSLSSLLEQDLDFTLHHYQEPCFDLWEETFGHHYHTRLVQFAALGDGSDWMDQTGDPARASAYRAAALELRERLDAHFDACDGIYVSHAVDASETAGFAQTKRLDIAIVLAVIQAARLDGPHGVLDPKVFATLARLEALFAKAYKINRERGASCAPAMGRYSNDVYYSGGAYYFSTLGAAQFYFCFAEAVGRGAMVPVSNSSRTLLADMLGTPPEALGATSLEARYTERLFCALLKRGDMFMAMVRVHMPVSGELSEQFDQTNGAQTSAKNLTWSHAAFITAFASRKAAVNTASGRSSKL